MIITSSKIEFPSIMITNKIYINEDQLGGKNIHSYFFNVFISGFDLCFYFTELGHQWMAKNCLKTRFLLVWKLGRTKKWTRVEIMIEKYFILPIQEKEQDHRGNKKSYKPRNVSMGKRSKGMKAEGWQDADGKFTLRRKMMMIIYRWERCVENYNCWSIKKS